MNQVFTHPGQPQMQAEVILASASSEGAKPIYTIRLRYPRIIHGEIMTHRVFSRNARSSRAVPVKTMLNEVRNTPFIPWHWGKNQKGMQAAEECNEDVVPSHWLGNGGLSREEAWLHARDTAAEIAEAYMEAGYHKQIPNRLLEPFSWIDTLITANEWDNFLWLREHEDAEPHLKDLAPLVHQAIDAADVKTLEPGNWHLPYITDEDWAWAYKHYLDDTDYIIEFLCRISAARCARISYKPFDGDASYKREMERYYSLVSADRVHASPLEHQATPDRTGHWENSGHFVSDPEDDWAQPELHGNLPGWVQYRKTVPNEAKMEGVL